MTDIERLRELLAKATPGPWQSMNIYQWDSIIGDIDGPDDGDMHYESVTDITSHHARSRANAALIVAAVNALPTLIAEVKRLRGVEARVMGAVVAELGGQFLEAWDCYALVPELADGGFLTSDHPLNGQTVALVPVPAGEEG